MRRMNNLVTLFSAMFAFFFGCFLSTSLKTNDKCSINKLSTNLNNQNDVFLMVLVLTAPNNFERRQMIRDTWLKLPKPSLYAYYPEELIFLPDYDNVGFLEQESPAYQSNMIKLFNDWIASGLNTVEIAGSFQIKHGCSYFISY